MEAGRDGRVPAWLRQYHRFWRPLLSRAEKARIVAAIAEEERLTTGEIHVHIAALGGGRDMLAFARRKFLRLGLDRTAQRNAVLILVSHWSHRYAIWGDEGLHAKAGPALWERARETLAAHFAAQRYAEGIEACVRAVGAELARHFPRAQRVDRNQVSDDVTED